MEDIQPCPFCSDVGTVYPQGKNFRVGCSNFYCKVQPMTLLEWETVDGAIMAWNDRVEVMPTPKPLPDLFEQLREAKIRLYRTILSIPDSLLTLNDVEIGYQLVKSKEIQDLLSEKLGKINE